MVAPSPSRENEQNEQNEDTIAKLERLQPGWSWTKLGGRTGSVTTQGTSTETVHRFKRLKPEYESDSDEEWAGVSFQEAKETALVALRTAAPEVVREAAAATRVPPVGTREAPPSASTHTEAERHVLGGEEGARVIDPRVGLQQERSGASPLPPPQQAVGDHLQAVRTGLGNFLETRAYPANRGRVYSDEAALAIHGRVLEAGLAMEGGVASHSAGEGGQVLPGPYTGLCIHSGALLHVNPLPSYPANAEPRPDGRIPGFSREAPAGGGVSRHDHRNA